MNRFVKLLLSLVMMAGLMTATTTAASAATQSGAPAGKYIFCAPGSDFAACVPDSWNPYAINCIQNEDNANYNVGLGFGTGFNSISTYQGILLRHWVYCGGDTTGKPHSFVVGNGWCMNWTRYVSRVTIGSGSVTVFGMPVASGNVRGSALVGNIFRLSTTNNNHYKVTAYLC
jgi:hypothetical protein